MVYKSETYRVTDSKTIVPDYRMKSEMYSILQANGETEEPSPSWMIWKKRRYVVAILAFFGFFNVYALRVNLSIAIVAMTANKTVVSENGTVTYEQEFAWDYKTKGFVLSSFFYGYILTQLIGGWLATKLGGQRVFGIGIAVTSALTVITPFAVKQSLYLLLAVRIIEGIFEGVTYPCIHAVWSKWAPPLERSRLATIGFSGSYVGTVISMPLCAVLADMFGWETIFYVFGVIGLLWFVCWWAIVSETPAQDRFITKYELNYIKESLGNQDATTKVKHPWKSIFTSMPVWAIVIGHFSENWGFYTLLTQLPTFMKDVLQFDLETTGFVSAVPYLAISITMQFAGYFADWFQVKGIFTTTQVRKIFNCGAYISQTIFMLAAAFLLTPIGTTVCLTLAVGLGGFAWAGFGVNHLDIAPQHAGILMGISNTFASIPGILSPIITGYIVTTPTKFEWQIVFFIGSAIYLFGCVFYGIFASGTLQPWATETQTLNEPVPVHKKKGEENSAYTLD